LELAYWANAFVGAIKSYTIALLAAVISWKVTEKVYLGYLCRQQSVDILKVRTFELMGYWVG
jgi:hypothetical protein